MSTELTTKPHGYHPILSTAYQLWPFLIKNREFSQKASRVLRSDQLPRLLMASPMHYLDWGGGAPLSVECAEAMALRMCDPRPLLNPHTGFGESPVIVQNMRRLVLEFFGASQDSHILIWTSGATQSLHIVGEHFLLNETSALVYSLESHTSVLGLRTIAKGPVGVASIENSLDIQWFRGHPPDPIYHGLYVLTGECNLSGAQLEDLPATVRRLRQAGYTVMLDAAKLACTPGGLNLAEVEADFVAVSLYKIFGAPTGLGALIVRVGSISKLTSSFATGLSYFGGGSVDAVSANSGFCIRSVNIVKALERGSINWLAITQQLPAALATFPKRRSWPFLSRHVGALIELLYSELKSSYHANGTPLCRVIAGNHGTTPRRQGPTLAAVYQWLDGSPIPFDLVQRSAHARGLLVRAGCCCNVGACQRWLHLTDADIKRNYESGRICGGVDDPAPSGFVRVGLGYMSTTSDVYAWVTFVRETFLDKTSLCVESPKLVNGVVSDSGVETATVCSISVYPLKGAAALVDASGSPITRWGLSCLHGGLLLDRQFVPLDPDGRVIHSKSSKYGPKLRAIATVLDPSRKCLWLRLDAELGPLLAPLTSLCQWELGENLLSYQGLVVGTSQAISLAEFSQRALGPGCTICPAEGVGSKDMLIVSKSSLEAAAFKTNTVMEPVIFRANLIIEGIPAHREYSWSDCYLSCSAGEVPLVVQRHCVRCSMTSAAASDATTASWFQAWR